MVDTHIEPAAGHASRRRFGASAIVIGIGLLLGACAGDTGAEPTRPADATTAPTSRTTPTPAAISTPAAAAPRSVEIDALGLDERLISLGLEADGSLEVPDDPDRVGWFSGGGRPGGPGPTVLAGHVDSETGPAVFSRLVELEPGDTIVVQSEDGPATTYAVERIRRVSQDDFPTADVFGSTPEDELRLITCTGTYDRARGGYEQNLVVFASAVA